MGHSGAINHDQTEPNNTAGITTLIVSSILIATSVVFCTYFFLGVVEVEKQAASSKNSYPEIEKLRIYEMETLNTLAWKGKSKRTVIIPISDAIDRVVQSYQN